MCRKVYSKRTRGKTPSLPREMGSQRRLKKAERRQRSSSCGGTVRDSYLSFNTLLYSPLSGNEHFYAREEKEKQVCFHGG